MASTVDYYVESRYCICPGDGYDGEVRVSSGSYYATDALLFDSRAILAAAAHLFDEHTGAVAAIFEACNGMQTLIAAKFLQHPKYDAQGNNDLAIVWLSSSAPAAADRYNLYRNNKEIS